MKQGEVQLEALGTELSIEQACSRLTVTAKSVKYISLRTLVEHMQLNHTRLGTDWKRPFTRGRPDSTGDSHFQRRHRTITQATHVLDPKSDVLITLHNPEAPWRRNLSQLTGTPTFLCSSRLLIKASSVFRLFLQGLMLQPLPYSSELRRLTAEDFDENAFWQVLAAIHLDGKLPGTMIVRADWDRPIQDAGPVREMPLTQLAKVAMVVDYYQCVNAVDAMAKVWLSDQLFPCLDGPGSWRFGFTWGGCSGIRRRWVWPISWP